MGDQTFNLFSAPLPIARYQDKGPLKKVVKDKKTKVKTTRLKLGLSLFVGLGGYCPTFWGQYKKRDGSVGFCGSKELKGTQSQT